MDNEYSSTLFDLSNKIAIVTGASGQLGGEYVLALLDAGASVAAFDIWLGNPKSKIKNISSEKFCAVEIDITQKNSIKEGLKTVGSKLGNPNILINMAAIDTPPHDTDYDTGSFETYPESSWQEMMDVNLKGMFLCCQVIGGHMASAGGGSIINISSL